MTATPDMVRYNTDGAKTNQAEFQEWLGSVIEKGIETDELDPGKSFGSEGKKGEDSPLRQAAATAIIAHWNKLEHQEQITKD